MFNSEVRKRGIPCKSCVKNAVGKRSIYLIPYAQPLDSNKRGLELCIQTIVFADGVCEIIHIHGSEVSQSLHVVGYLVMAYLGVRTAL